MNALKMKNEIMYLYEKHDGNLQYLFNLGLNLLMASLGTMYGMTAQEKLEKCIIEFSKDYGEIKEVPTP